VEYWITIDYRSYNPTGISLPTGSTNDRTGFIWNNTVDRTFNSWRVEHRTIYYEDTAAEFDSRQVLNLPGKVGTPSMDQLTKVAA
jgi:hypothetical protein